MLEKIINIKPNDAYKGRKKSSNFEKFLRKNSAASGVDKDSLTFSPAAKYLHLIHWNLKEIKFLTNDKILIRFFVDDFEIKTEIDFLNFYTSPRHLFDVIYDKKSGSGSKKCRGLLSLKMEKIQILNETEKINLIAHHSLFERYLSMNVHSDFDKYDNYATRELLDGIEYQLSNEMQDMMNIIYTLINKTEKFNLINYFEFDSDSSSSVIIEKISLLND